jgi:hypothetical protein
MPGFSLKPANGVISLSAKAKALTRYLLDDVALPGFLASQGDLLLAFTTGAAAATALYKYLHRNREDRAKISLAVFHITRIIEKTPEYQARLNNPNELAQLIDTEVNRILNIHLNEDEAASTMIELKRKLWNELDVECLHVTKRRRSNTAGHKDGMFEQNSETREADADLPQSSHTTTSDPGAISSPSVWENTKLSSPGRSNQQEGSIMADIDKLYMTLMTPTRRKKKTIEKSSSLQKTSFSQDSQSLECSSPQNLFNPGRSPVSDDLIGYTSLLEATTSSWPELPPRPPTRRAHYDSSPLPSSSGRSTYKYPSSSESEGATAPPMSEQRSKLQASTGFGLDYDDQELYLSASPVASSKASPKGEDQVINNSAQPLSMLNSGLIRTHDPDVLGQNIHNAPALEKAKAKKAASTITIQQPPNAMAVLDRNEMEGTWLRSIQKGVSPHECPASDVTEYRVAGSKGLYKQMKANRKERRSIRDFFKQGVEILQAQQEQAEVLLDKEEVEWPNPTLKYSSSGENDTMDVNASLSSLQSIGSPPSAPEISPPMPSPPEEPQTPKQAPPSFSSDLPLLPSDVNFSSPIEMKENLMSDVIRVASPPAKPQESSPPSITSSPPIKKRGRPKKVAAEQKEVITEEVKPETPMPAKRLGRPPKAAAKLQMPSTPVSASRSSGHSRQTTAEPQTPGQAKSPSGRNLRSSAFKGSYKV